MPDKQRFGGRGTAFRGALRCGSSLRHRPTFRSAFCAEHITRLFAKVIHVVEAPKPCTDDSGIDLVRARFWFDYVMETVKGRRGNGARARAGTIDQYVDLAHLFTRRMGRK